jgi:hypothetical protein
MSPDARRVVSGALVVATGVLLVLTSLVGYARLALVDSNGFANRATSTLRDSSVRTLVAEEVTDRLVLSNRSELLAARPLIISAVSGIVGGGTFASLFHKAALDVHRAVFDRDQDTITLTLVDVGTVAGEALQAIRPKLADELEQTGNVPVLKRKVGGVTGDLARVGDRIRALALLLLGLTVAAAAAALALAADRRRTASRLGIAAIAAGVLVVIAYAIGRLVVLGSFSDPDERAAAAAVWSGFLGDLRSVGWVLAGSGAVLAAAAGSLIDPDLLERPLERARRIATTEPRTTWLRVLRALALIALGVLIVVEPMAALHVVATIGGVYLVHEGTQAILRLIYRPPRREPQPEPEEEPAEPGRLRRVAVVAVALAIVATATTVFLASGGVEAPSAAIGTCNGSRALCDRRLDEIALPATHNSMSAPLPGWFSAEQERSIAGQLEDGIRGLLLDTHYADKLSNGKIRTAFGSTAALREAVQQDGASDSSVQAALRLRDRLGFTGKGDRGMYLCHTFCELGATPLAGVLEDLKEFLVTHPGEVVVMVNQDYVTPADFVKAIEDAGLERYAFRGFDDTTWPTLQEMIDADRRLVLLAENHAGAAPWYRLAYDKLVEETPYHFGKTTQLTAQSTLAASCVANRGPASGAPLFLLNHWISTDPIPLERDAKTVNAYGPLLRRAQECERVRDHLPNLVAVNFYKQGELFRVVDTLNGLDGS